MFLLDTNVVSEMRKIADGKAAPGVAAWAGQYDASELWISVITLMELEIGIRLKERKDAMQGALLREWMEQRVLPEFKERALPIDARVALRCAALHVPNPHGERDALIAATALTHNMTVVTRNVSDFASTKVPIINPWDFDQSPAGA
jgi:predicted nucleic acid-binding protein